MITTAGIIWNLSLIALVVIGGAIQIVKDKKRDKKSSKQMRYLWLIENGYDEETAKKILKEEE
jgi:hypothetical protein